MPEEFSIASMPFLIVNDGKIWNIKDESETLKDIKELQEKGNKIIGKIKIDGSEGEQTSILYYDASKLPEFCGN